MKATIVDGQYLETETMLVDLRKAYGVDVCAGDGYTQHNVYIYFDYGPVRLTVESSEAAKDLYKEIRDILVTL
jgi:hypothetical protein